MDEIRRALLGDMAAEKCDHNATEMRPSFISDHSGGTNKMVDHVSDAGKMVDHIPDATKMMPLTLEQLRQMDGQPVWVKCLDSKKYTDPPIGWRIVERSITGTIGVWNGESCFAERDYGVDWLAYAYPPAHIDREAWEPCGEWCRKNCMNCDHNADELFGDADYCKDCHKYSKWESSVHKFCERCGRPRTPEAWELLEKRLRGCMG